MAEYVAQGDGWDIALPLMNDDHPIILAALNGDTAEVRRQASRRWRAGMRRVDLCTGRDEAICIIIGAGGAMGGSR